MRSEAARETQGTYVTARSIRKYEGIFAIAKNMRLGDKYDYNKK